VLAESGRGIISDHIMELIVSVAVIALFLTPYLVNLAPWAAGWVEARRNPQRPAAAPALEAVTSALEPEARTPHPSQEPAPPPGLHGRILIVGFGPAGQRVAEALMGRYRDHLLVIDLNPRSAAVAQRYGLAMHVGNAAQAEVLERAGVHAAAVVVVTVPDPSAARQVVLLCKHMNTAAQVVVRSRYHAYRWELQMAGADVVVDEEEYVGMRLAAEVRRALHGAEQV
jgi:monovalent cation:H+ antiporter-2, CPA2 family